MATSDPGQLAKAARLRYVNPQSSGIRRLRRGSGFQYRASPPVRPAQHLARIQSLAIPPAWRDVWICADPRGHLQATGIDARGRLQYRYHPDWTATCETAKFRRIAEFGRELPAIRRRVARDLARAGLARAKVLAAIVRLLERSLIRVGNEEYARSNGSFGLTTLRKRHVELPGRALIQFRFLGKSRVAHDIDLSASDLASVIKACQRLRGRDLFQYQEPDGTIRDVTASDVNAYLGQITAGKVTAKDFRTWGATVLMHKALLNMPASGPARHLAKDVRRALQTVAEALGNTVAVCRKSYVHPALARRFLEGRLAPVKCRGPALGVRDLSALERATLAAIERHSRPSRPVT